MLMKEILMIKNKQVFKMPKNVKIAGRKSSVTNSFVNGIILCIKPTVVEVEECLSILGLNHQNLTCAYCGDKCSEWDHFRPIVKDKKPTGYISEIANLVPSCGKCNQSKSGAYWKSWMLSGASGSPKSRNIPDLEDRVRRLDEFENWKPVQKINFEDIAGEHLWNEYWTIHDKLHAMMSEAQLVQNKIRDCINPITHNKHELVNK
jgi:hypothetical protein